MFTHTQDSYSPEAAFSAAKSYLDDLQGYLGKLPRDSQALDKLTGIIVGKSEQEAQKTLTDLNALISGIEGRIARSSLSDSASLRGSITEMAINIAADLDTAKSVSQAEKKIPNWFGVDHAIEALNQIFDQHISDAPSKSPAEFGKMIAFLTCCEIASGSVLDRIKPHILGVSTARLGSDGIFLSSSAGTDLQNLATPHKNELEVANTTTRFRVIDTTPTAAEKLNEFFKARSENLNLQGRPITSNPLADVFNWKFVAPGKTNANSGVWVSMKCNPLMVRKLEANATYGFCRNNEAIEMAKTPEFSSFAAFGAKNAIPGMSYSPHETMQALNDLLVEYKNSGLVGVIGYKFSEPKYDYGRTSIFARISGLFSKFTTELLHGGPRTNMTIIFQPPRVVEGLSKEHQRVDQRYFGVALSINMPQLSATNLQTLINKRGPEAVFYDLINSPANSLGGSIVTWLREGLIEPITSAYQAKVAAGAPVRGSIWDQIEDREKESAFAHYVVCNLDSKSSRNNLQREIGLARQAFSAD